MSEHLNQPVWDGNGGTLDPKTASDHDLLVAIHVKMDQVVIPQLKQLSNAQAAQERGDFTRAQERAILGVVQDDDDKALNRRSMKAPIAAAVIALLALVCTIVMTLSYGGIFG